jgi:hypothetical protein
MKRERKLSKQDMEQREIDIREGEALLWAQIATFRNDVLEEAAVIAERYKEAPAAAIRAAKGPSLQQCEVEQVN